MFYSSKQLRNDNELKEFIKGYSLSFKDRTKIPKRELDIELLRESNFIWGIYKGNKLVAGFITNFKPSRCLGEFSQNEKQEILAKFKKEEICELVGIWKTSSEKSAFTTLFMWATIIYKTLSINRRFIFGCSRSQKVGKTFYYTNELQFIENPHSELKVFYYTRKQFVMTFVNSFKFFIIKKIGLKKITAPKTGEQQI